MDLQTLREHDRAEENLEHQAAAVRQRLSVIEQSLGEHDQARQLVRAWVEEAPVAHGETVRRLRLVELMLEKLGVAKPGEPIMAEKVATFDGWVRAFRAGYNVRFPHETTEQALGRVVKEASVA